MDADKRAEKPETDTNALALFGNVPPAIEFAAQPPAGTVFAQERPFVPMYPPESFSSNTRGRGTSPVTTTPAPAAPVSFGLALASAAATLAVPPPTPSPRPPQTPSTSTPRPQSDVTFAIQPRRQPQQPQGASGPSLLEQADLLASQAQPSTPSPRHPCLPRPAPGTRVSVRRQAPSLFIQRKPARHPAQRPPPGGEGGN